MPMPNKISGLRNNSAEMELAYFRNEAISSNCNSASPIIMIPRTVKNHFAKNEGTIINASPTTKETMELMDAV